MNDLHMPLGEFLFLLGVVLSPGLCVCLCELMSLIPSFLPISFHFFVSSSFISAYITPYTCTYTPSLFLNLFS